MSRGGRLLVFMVTERRLIELFERAMIAIAVAMLALLGLCEIVGCTMHVSFDKYYASPAVPPGCNAHRDTSRGGFQDSSNGKVDKAADLEFFEGLADEIGSPGAGNQGLGSGN